MLDYLAPEILARVWEVTIIGVRIVDLLEVFAPAQHLFFHYQLDLLHSRLLIGASFLGFFFSLHHFFPSFNAFVKVYRQIGK
jgi:hypothetical protein